jgi:hypothetical protein
MHRFPPGSPTVVSPLEQKHGLWRVAEDDPDPGLYAESNDADTVISHMTACRSTFPIVTGSSRAAAWLP